MSARDWVSLGDMPLGFGLGLERKAERRQPTELRPDQRAVTAYFLLPEVFIGERPILRWARLILTGETRVPRELRGLAMVGRADTEPVVFRVELELHLPLVGHREGPVVPVGSMVPHPLYATNDAGRVYRRIAPWLSQPDLGEMVDAAQPLLGGANEISGAWLGLEEERDVEVR